MRTLPILVAEDDDDDYFFLLHRLKAARVTNPVVRFRDGAEAIEYLETIAASDAAILFLDIKMPRIDGFGVLQWVRARKDLDALRTVILSGSGHHEDIARAAKLGAERYLVKYPQAEELAAVVNAPPIKEG